MSCSCLASCLWWAVLSSLFDGGAWKNLQLYCAVFAMKLIQANGLWIACSNTRFFFLTWKMKVMLWVKTCVCSYKPFYPFFSFCSLGYRSFQNCERFLIIRLKICLCTPWSLWSALRITDLPACFSPQAAVGSQSCLQHLFSFPREEFSIHRKKKKCTALQSLILKGLN